MENKEVKIDWGTWNNPKTTTHEQPTSTPPKSWNDLQPDYSSEQETPIETPQETPQEESVKWDDFKKGEVFQTWEHNDPTKYSYLGVTKAIELSPELYMFYHDNKKACADIDLDNLKPLDDDGRFKVESLPNSELSQILGSIQNIATDKGLNLDMFFLIKNVPDSSSINIFKGKPKMNFIYVLQGDKNSGNIVLDLSSLGGPSQKVMDTSNGMLLLFEGWIPYRITRNLSQINLLTIAGSLN